jgi:hypothetical protein
MIKEKAKRDEVLELVALKNKDVNVQALKNPEIY